MLFMYSTSFDWTSNGSLRAALYEISNFDCDFNGDNGEEYLWDSAKEKGFSTNVDYVISEVMKNECLYDVINEFFKMWMGYDNYYEDYDFSIIEEEYSHTMHLVVAYNVEH